MSDDFLKSICQGGHTRLNQFIFLSCCAARTALRHNCNGECTADTWTLVKQLTVDFIDCGLTEAGGRGRRLCATSQSAHRPRSRSCKEGKREMNLKQRRNCSPKTQDTYTHWKHRQPQRVSVAQNKWACQLHANVLVMANVFGAAFSALLCCALCLLFPAAQPWQHARFLPFASVHEFFVLWREESVWKTQARFQRRMIFTH